MIRTSADFSTQPGSAQDAIALTFDDGPDPVWTPQVLEALRAVDARAAFFVTAPLARRFPYLISEILTDGHAVELHCTRHVRHTEQAREQVEADVRSGLRDLRKLGVSPWFWRPPWGVLAPWTTEIAEEFGLRLALWTADTHDWRGDNATEMLKAISPGLGPGAVVLMHDGLGPGARRSGCEETVALIGTLVASIRSLGCEPVTIDLVQRTSFTQPRSAV
ncbi:MAG: polysaccharide deacetylase family protein [Rubrobacteraceae bacterium]|nr:polysaccharide deacetylase family protein [Rubrobacter sp.]